MDELFNLVKDQKKKEEGALNEEIETTSVATAVRVEVSPPKKKKRPEYHFKGIKEFNKKLTSKHLMQSDLCEDSTDKDYKDKVAACFQMRAKTLKNNQNKQNNQWEAALTSEKNYVMYKKGYKHMLEDIE